MQALPATSKVVAQVYFHGHFVGLLRRTRPDGTFWYTFLDSKAPYIGTESGLVLEDGQYKKLVNGVQVDCDDAATCIIFLDHYSSQCLSAQQYGNVRDVDYSEVFDFTSDHRTMSAWVLSDVEDVVAQTGPNLFKICRMCADEDTGTASALIASSIEHAETSEGATSGAAAAAAASSTPDLAASPERAPPPLAPPRKKRRRYRKAPPVDSSPDVKSFDQFGTEVNEEAPESRSSSEVMGPVLGNTEEGKEEGTENNRATPATTLLSFQAANVPPEQDPDFDEVNNGNMDSSEDEDGDGDDDGVGIAESDSDDDGDVVLTSPVTQGDESRASGRGGGRFGGGGTSAHNSKSTIGHSCLILRAIFPH